MTSKKDDKLININLFVFKGKLTFKQLLTIISVLALIGVFAFSSFQISSKWFSYQKKPLEVTSKNIQVK